MKFITILTIFTAQVFSAATLSQDLQTVIANSNKLDQNSGNKVNALSSDGKSDKHVVSNLVAASKVALGTYSGSYHFGVSSYPSCKEGLMFCDHYSYGFWTCAQGKFVYRNCGPGTKCVQKNGNLYCDYA